MKFLFTKENTAVSFQIDIDLSKRTISAKMLNKYDFGVIYHKIPTNLVPCMIGSEGITWECNIVNVH